MNLYLVELLILFRQQNAVIFVQKYMYEKYMY